MTIAPSVAGSWGRNARTQTTWNPELRAFVEGHRTHGPLIGNLSVSDGSDLVTTACTCGARLIRYGDGGAGTGGAVAALDVQPVRDVTLGRNFDFL